MISIITNNLIFLTTGNQRWVDTHFQFDCWFLANKSISRGTTRKKMMKLLKIINFLGQGKSRLLCHGKIVNLMTLPHPEKFEIKTFWYCCTPSKCYINSTLSTPTIQLYIGTTYLQNLANFSPEYHQNLEGTWESGPLFSKWSLFWNIDLFVLVPTSFPVPHLLDFILRQFIFWVAVLGLHKNSTKSPGV